MNDTVSRKKMKLSNDSSKWVSATQTRNYLLGDPILDWLKLYSKTLPFSVELPPSLPDEKGIPSSFTEFIMKRGKDFEEYIMAKLKARFGAHVVDIGASFNHPPYVDTSELKFFQTLEAMKRGVPFIYNCCVRNSDNQTHGIPDLLVRSDYLNSITSNASIEQDVAMMKAHNLPGKYHYVVIDIKFTTLHLKADGTHLLNQGSIPAYKGQLRIYTEAVGKMQGYEPSCAYLLGRGVQYTSKGTSYKIRNSFDRLGTVNFESADSEFIDLTAQAVEWIRGVRENGREWNPLDVGNIPSEMYPNMSNTYDYPWTSVKKEIASRTKELTSLWYVSTKHRDKAHSQEIYSYDNPNCCAKSLGLPSSGSVAPILDRIIRINRDECKEVMIPSHIDLNESKDDRTMFFYVDFETLSDFFTLDNSYESMICQIGVGWEFGGEWRYKSLCVKTLSQSEEKEICSQFVNTIREVLKTHKMSDAVLVHWSSAETSSWVKVIEKHFNNKNSSVTMRWLDLLGIFKENQVVIKDCFSYGLKDVTKALARHGKVSKNLYNNIGISDGMDASYLIYLASLEGDISQSKRMAKVVQYNEQDCRSLYEIMKCTTS